VRRHRREREARRSRSVWPRDDPVRDRTVERPPMFSWTTNPAGVRCVTQRTPRVIPSGVTMNM
jgi:hypothetical protein